MIRRYNEALAAASEANFDELNVRRICTELFEGLDEDNRAAFEDMSDAVYEFVADDYDLAKNRRRIAATALVAAYLARSNRVTRYEYDNEVERKREYLIESIYSGDNRAYEFRRSMSYWQNMTAQYAEMLTDETSLQVFIDNDVRYVEWRTEQDGKVCSECQDRSGNRYPADDAPPKAHWHCRCYYVPVIEGRDRESD